MNWTTIARMVWGILNSPAGITVMAAVTLWILNRVFARRPLWATFEGTIIAAVKWAEREIPDDTPDKAFNRLNAALGYVIKVYEEARGKTPDARTKQELKEGIQVVHAELEAAGGLNRKADAA